MVDRAWWHPCCAHLRKGQHRQRRECDHCGLPGVPDGWGRSLVEQWCHYKRQWGLDPTKRIRAHYELVEPLSIPCPQCNGHGYRSDWTKCLACPMCEGSGRFWVADDEEIEAIYAPLAREYPDDKIRRPEHRRLDEVDGPGTDGD